MKKLKLAKTSKHCDGVDMISNLPDHALQLILSGIPSTKEVIRTCILSRRWRYLWTSVPSIDIDCTQGLDPLKEFDCNKFKEFVDWVVVNKSIDLNSFRLWCANYYNMSTIWQWIHAIVMRKVKVVDLMFSSKEMPGEIEVPQCLVTCGSLEVLRLCLIGCSLSLPKCTGFLALRVLELKDVDLLGGNIVECILESCPLLEDLSLIDCKAIFLVISCPKLKELRIDTRKIVSDAEYGDGVIWRMCRTLEISCPKLEFLNLKDYVAVEFTLQNLYSLKKAVIHPKNLDQRSCSVLDISQVQSLSISLYCVRQCYSLKELEDGLISLPNLKNLEITVDDSHKLIPYLKCVPNLKSLSLIFVENVYGLVNWIIKEPETISILTHHLKKAELLDFPEEKGKLIVARALLEHGKELEEIVFKWDDEARFHEGSMETLNQVSKFHKASPTVKVKVVFDPSQAKSTKLCTLTMSWYDYDAEAWDYQENI